ncbi:MAG: DUF2306 domain-containing protein [Polaribacter sp.]
MIPCFFIRTYLLVAKKGTLFHKSLGKVYMVLMFTTAIITLFMPAYVGPQFLNHFGYIHLFSFLTLYSVPTAIIAIKKGQIKKHKIKMILLYLGPIIIAGVLLLVLADIYIIYFLGTKKASFYNKMRPLFF